MPDHPLSLADCSIFTEPQQGANYADLLAVARRAEDLGFGAFFRSDHYVKMGDVDGLPGPTDAWITLAGLARDTSTIRLGTLVTSMTFRWPGVLAISVAQVDEMSGGRVELGLGAGWFDAEHHAYGIDFPDLGERFDRLEEQFAVLTGLWSTPVGDTFDHPGPRYPISDSPALPKPVQRHPRSGGVPMLVGGRGPNRTPRLAARYAGEFNLPFPPFDEVVPSLERVRAACRDIGRDPDELRWSAALVACVGADDAEFERRAAAIGREPDELRENGICGTASEARATLDRWLGLGLDRMHLQVLDLSDLDHLDAIADVITA